MQAINYKYVVLLTAVFFSAPANAVTGSNEWTEEIKLQFINIASAGIGDYQLCEMHSNNENKKNFVERVFQKGVVVRKRRVGVDDADLALRLTSMDGADWEGGWFRDRLDQQCLRPVCQVTYQRFARMKATDEGTVRLTIDSRLTGRLAHEWQVPSSPLDEASQPGGIPLLKDQRILELKFRGAMPVQFRRLIEEQQLQVTSFSKYRTSVEGCVPLDWLSGETTRGTDDA